MFVAHGAISLFLARIASGCLPPWASFVETDRMLHRKRASTRNKQRALFFYSFSHLCVFIVLPRKNYHNREDFYTTKTQSSQRKTIKLSLCPLWLWLSSVVAKVALCR
jgi:hypothetical protein